MDALTLTTETRVKGETGKGPARRLRARGLVPGVFYGPGAEPIGIAVAPKALTQVLSTPHRRNALLKLNIAGQEHLAMVKELQVHPVTRAPLHLDLYKVSLDREIEVVGAVRGRGPRQGRDRRRRGQRDLPRPAGAHDARQDPGGDHGRRHEHGVEQPRQHEGPAAAGGRDGRARAGSPRRDLRRAAQARAGRRRGRGGAAAVLRAPKVLRHRQRVRAAAAAAPAAGGKAPAKG